jgi:acyl-CoA reductase-like NAD-dependent aldehyde dehydrogenase
MLALTKYQRYTFAKVYGNFVNGEFVKSKATKHYDIKNPLTQEVVAQVPQTTQ